MISPEEVSVVIPTLDPDPITLESVPDTVETAVVSEGNRAEARNLGAAQTDGKILVFCDDDITFEESFFWQHVREARQGLVIGLEDFDFGLLLTRFFVLSRQVFESLGGFDERLNHMEDTEFCLHALNKGLELRGLPRDSIHHEEHESVGQGTLQTLQATAYLCVRYPQYAPSLLKGVLNF
ncbi:hypothetical protein GRX01_11040 [Halobaculum sp. WSA2]|uniref:Glycosyl transferase family 2 n=1 Tax=Halobaculum saliterrae TaxID=2073113 RepID=A0A6B0T5U6_9EURY|nr:hypothetical protein [Halobaculum saliterrae]MXR41869.1 hypothetical protein [Halobaculum saliterrae]